jgi:Putative Actinobacterial Holin-X, holin superfamily III
MEQPNSQHEAQVRERESAIGLLRRLVDEFSVLFRKEVALAKAEAVQSFSHLKAAAISMASGGAVLFAGLLVLLAAAVLGLSHVVADWLAALIVGGLVSIVGFVMINSGKNKFDSSALKPERTQRALQRDKDLLARRMQ